MANNKPKTNSSDDFLKRLDNATPIPHEAIIAINKSLRENSKEAMRKIAENFADIESSEFRNRRFY